MKMKKRIYSKTIMNEIKSLFLVILQIIGYFLLVVAAVGFLIGLSIIPAAIIHWILVNLFSYTVLSLWQIWGILIIFSILFGGRSKN